MKRLAKILSVVMIACLLCRIVATAVFAADEEAIVMSNFLDISNEDKGIKTQKQQDYNGSLTDLTKDAEGKTILNQKNSFWNFVDKSIVEGDKGDNFLNLSLNQDAERANPAKSGSFLIDLNYGGSGTPDAAYRFFRGGLDGNENAARFVTVDFDICATHYVFTIAGNPYYVTEIFGEGDSRYILLDDEILGVTTPDEATGKHKYTVVGNEYTLSYVETTFTPVVSTYNVDGNVVLADATNIFQRYFKIAQNENGVWGIAPAGTQWGVVEDFTPLSQIPGEWNHITFICRYNSTSPRTGSAGAANLATHIAYFVNGDYIGHAFRAIAIDTKVVGTSASLTAIQATVAAGNLEKTAPRFSMGVDNIAVNTYSLAVEEKTGYSSAGTISEWWASWFPGNSAAKKANTPLLQSIAKDIVYNPDTYLDRDEYYTIAKTVNGVHTTYRYSTQKTLLSGIVAEENTNAITVTSTTAIENYTPDQSITDTVKTVTIHAPSVTISDEARAANYTCIPIIPGEKYEVKISNTELWVQFYDTDGTEIGEPVKLLPDMDPAEIAPKDEKYNGYYIENDTYYQYTWLHTAYHGDNVGEDIVLAAMDETTMGEYYSSSFDQIEPMPVVFGSVVDTTKTKITWKAPNETVFAEEWFSIGTEVVHPTAESMKADEENRFFAKTSETNGWYDKYYAGWKLDGADEDSDIAVVGAVYVVDENEFEPIANVDGIRYNLTLCNRPIANIYAPITVKSTTDHTITGTVTGADIRTDITDIQFYNVEGGEAVGKYVKLGTKYLLRCTSAMNAFGNTEITVFLGFKVDGYEDTIYQTVTISVAKYASTVADNTDHGSEEATLAVALAKYMSANSAIRGNEPSAEIEAFIEKHNSCACNTRCEELYNERTESDVDTSDYDYSTHLGVFGIKYLFNITEPGLRVYLHEENCYLVNSEMKKLDLSLAEYYAQDSDPDKADKIARVKFTYLSPNPSKAGGTTAWETLNTYTALATIVKDSEGNDVRVATASTQDFMMYDMTQIVTITLLNAAGDVIDVVVAGEDGNTTYTGEITYSLAEYIGYLETLVADQSKTEQERADAQLALNAAKASFVFGGASYDYKVYSEAERRNEEDNPAEKDALG